MASVTIATQVPSAANAREHWAVKARRARAHRSLVALAMRSSRQMIGECVACTLTGAAVVTLTRLGPRKLDDDNLASALKSVRDGVADVFDVDDGEAFYIWRYEQERSDTQGVRITVEAV